jgi:hypothetical protein
MPKGASEFCFGFPSLFFCHWSFFSIEDCVDQCCGFLSRRCGSGSFCLFETDPDPTFHFDVDPDICFHFDAVPDPTFYFSADPVDANMRSLVYRPSTAIL